MHGRLQFGNWIVWEEEKFLVVVEISLYKDYSIVAVQLFNFILFYFFWPRERNNGIYYNKGKQSFKK